MSERTVIRGRRRNSSHVHDVGRSTRPKQRKAQRLGSKRGVRPYVRTGHFSVRTWPGGTRSATAGSGLFLWEILKLPRGAQRLKNNLRRRDPPPSPGNDAG